jgi:hypothetical protein
LGVRALTYLFWRDKIQYVISCKTGSNLGNTSIKKNSGAEMAAECRRWRGNARPTEIIF